MARILYVCDNRDVRNWGSRGSSIALGQLISTYGETVGVGRSWSIDPVPVGPGVGRLHRSHYGKKGLRFLLRRGVVRRAMPLLGGRTDFLDLADPARSVAHFRRAARGNQELAELQQRFQEADVVLVNGEGSLVFRDPPPRDVGFQLFAVELAASLGKPVGYLNALASDCPYSGANPVVEDAARHSLRACTVVAARDPVSRDRLYELGLADVAMVPDAMFMWSRRYARLMASTVGRDTPEVFETWPESDRFLRGWSDWPAEYVCVGGSSRHPYQDASVWPEFFEALVRRVREATGLPVVLVDCGGDRPTGGDRYLQEVAERTGCVFIGPQLNPLLAAYLLAHARAFVSGRFHPSIMASFGGTPCTLLASAAHKSLSIQDQLEYTDPTVFPIDLAAANLAAVAEDVAAKFAAGEPERERIRQVAARLGEQAEDGLAEVTQVLVKAST